MADQTLSDDVRESYRANLRKEAKSKVETAACLAGLAGGGIAYVLLSKFMEPGGSFMISSLGAGV